VTTLRSKASTRNRANVDPPHSSISGRVTRTTSTPSAERRGRERRRSTDNNRVRQHDAANIAWCRPGSDHQGELAGRTSRPDRERRAGEEDDLEDQRDRDQEDQRVRRHVGRGSDALTSAGRALAGGRVFKDST
jgi:hypothetical protein